MRALDTRNHRIVALNTAHVDSRRSRQRVRVVTRSFVPSLECGVERVAAESD